MLYNLSLIDWSHLLGSSSTVIPSKSKDPVSLPVEVPCSLMSDMVQSEIIVDEKLLLFACQVESLEI